MGPRDRRRTPQDDLFRSELVNLINLEHPLVKLAGRIDWSVFEREWGELFASSTGRPAAAPRLIAGLSKWPRAAGWSSVRSGSG